jgi:pimeloyl-ACP methyl ester carboxylesterase
MAAGLAVTKEPGTDPFARRFADAGFTVLAFDYRRLGESGGHPRQITRVREQLQDWQAAIECARRLPEVDPARVAIWGFSQSGGHVFRVAAANADLGAAIAHAPNADGVKGSANAMRETPMRAMLRLNAAALRDVLGALVGRDPLLVPLTGPRGSLASLTTADARNGPGALNPDDAYVWQQEIAARSAVGIGFYRPGRIAKKISVPLLVLAYEHDGVAPHEPAVRAGTRAPHGEVVTLPGGHYEGFMGGHEQAVKEQLTFLQRHLLNGQSLERDQN